MCYTLSLTTPLNMATLYGSSPFRVRPFKQLMVRDAVAEGDLAINHAAMNKGTNFIDRWLALLMRSG